MTYDPEQDHYRLLRVRSDASLATLKRAHRELSRRYHPDHNPDDAAAEEKTKRVNEAWHTLRDPARRQAYDAARAAHRASASGRRPRSSSPARGARPSSSSTTATATGYDPWPQRARAPAVDPFNTRRRDDVPPVVRFSVRCAMESESPLGAAGWVLFGALASAIDASARKRRGRG